MTSPARVASRYIDKTAMAVLIRNVAKHNWGYFSREDERMHLQTVDQDSLEGPKKVKFWLENRGRRTFEIAVGKLDGALSKQLESKVTAQRRYLETRWVQFMLKHDWLTATLKGSIVTLTAYPGTHNAYSRTIDLRRHFRGAYRGPKSWDETPPSVDFDLTNGLLAVGWEENLDEREHIEVSEHLFTD
jgi:hypothetical protein